MSNLFGLTSSGLTSQALQTFSKLKNSKASKEASKGFSQLFEKINIKNIMQGIYDDFSQANFKKMNVIELAATVMIAWQTFTLTSFISFYGLVGFGAYQLGKHVYTTPKPDVLEKEEENSPNQISQMFEKCIQLKESTAAKAIIAGTQKGGALTFNLLKKVYDRLLAGIVGRAAKNKTVILETTRLKATTKIAGVLGGIYGINRFATLLGFYALVAAGIFVAHQHYSNNAPRDPAQLEEAKQ